MYLGPPVASTRSAPVLEYIPLYKIVTTNFLYLLQGVG